MVVAKLMGGLGNQLFQYAAGRALAVKRNEKLFIDLSFLNADPKGAYTKRNFELDQVKYVADIATEKVLNEFKVEGIVDRVLNKAGLKSHKVFYEQKINYTAAFESLPENVLLSGYWQCEKYFSPIRQQLLEEISPAFEFTAEGKQTLSKVKSSNSVSIHVRRGDYVSLDNAATFHGTCDISYYKKAISILEEKFKDLHYFIFSDDIEWCRNAFQFLDKKDFVGDLPGKKAAEDLFIMSSCRHNIIANSSYSWWGAWLNRNPGTVIAPGQWFKKNNEQTSDLIPERWLRI